MFASALVFEGTVKRNGCIAVFGGLSPLPTAIKASTPFSVACLLGWLFAFRSVVNVHDASERFRASV